MQSSLVSRVVGEKSWQCRVWHNIFQPFSTTDPRQYNSVVVCSSQNVEEIGGDELNFDDSGFESDTEELRIPRGKSIAHHSLYCMMIDD